MGRRQGPRRRIGQDGRVRGDPHGPRGYGGDTGLPWGGARAVGAGHHEQACCLLPPPNVTPTNPIRVEQAAYHPSLPGLRPVAVRLPDAVAPPGAAVP